MGMNRPPAANEVRPPAPRCPPGVSQDEWWRETSAPGGSIVTQTPLKQEDNFIPGLLIGGIVGACLG